MEEYFLNYFQPEVAEMLTELIKDFFRFGTISGLIIFLGRYISSILKKSRNNKDLNPFYNNSILKEVRKKYIRTKCQNIDPSNEANLKDSFAFAVREDLLDFFLKKVFPAKNIETKFYLILADAGMGKTTFMLNLFYRFHNLRNIILKNIKIRIIPLGENYGRIIDAIKNIETPKSCILLLDALDEAPMFITDEEVNTKFNDLIELVQDFKTVIITCRTHFFTKEKDEPYELKIKKYNTSGNGYHVVKKLYISPFDNNDIDTYLFKTFRFYERSKIDLANKIVESANDLFIRPMLLSYIRELVSENKNFKLSFDIYETLIKAWINREANKYSLSEKEIFKSNLYFFSYEIASYIYHNYNKTGLFVKLQDAYKIAAAHNIKLTDLEIKSRTLLNRNSEGSYKFSHKSIFEFFLSYFAYMSRQYNGHGGYNLTYNLAKFDQAKKFLEELQVHYRIEFMLPNFYDSIEIKGAKIAEQVFKEKYKHQAKIKWISGEKYEVEQGRN